MAVINATEVGLDGVPPNTFFGNPATDGINWAAHDPATLAENLRWTRIYMYWGNGQPGPYDSAPVERRRRVIEALIWHDNNDFEARLEALGIPAYFDDYGPGTHSWPYWTRDLRWSIDPIMRDFAHPAPRARPRSPTPAPTNELLGRTAGRSRCTARRASSRRSSTPPPSGFALAGSGSATVLTPAGLQAPHPATA